MNGISNSIFNNPPVRKPVGITAHQGQSATTTKSAPLRATPAQDLVHFEGRNRKKPDNTKTPVETSSEESEWSGDESSSSSSETLSEKSSSQPSQKETPSPKNTGSRYPLRKRPKTDDGKPADNNKKDGPNLAPWPPRRNAVSGESSGGRPPQGDPKDELGLKLLLALLSGGQIVAEGDSDSESDSDEDDKKAEFKVISHKKSPFGPNAEKLGFKRIAGMEPLKADLNRLLVDQLKHPQLYKDYGLENSSSGVLLYGPPGNGKTFFAKALAEEAEANFLELHPSTIASPFIHQTSKLIGNAFNAAAEAAKKSKKPTVLLIDEVDAVAPQRGGEVTSNHNNEEVAEFLNQLNECSGKNVFVVATTNLPEKLDPALIRSGRMNAKIYVGAPDDKSREQVLKHYLGQRSSTIIDDKLDTSDLAAQTKGYSIADLQELVNQAARHALEKREKISADSFKLALKKVHPSITESTEESYKQLMSKFENKPSSDAWKNMYI